MNLYDILNVPHNATKKQIKQSFKKLVFKYHPDINKNGEEDFKIINLAYEILSNDNKRKKYDEQLNNDNTQLYDVFKYFFGDNIINFLCTDKNQINSFNVTNIKRNVYNKLFDLKLSDIFNVSKFAPHLNITETDSDVDIDVNTSLHDSDDNNDIYGEISVNLDEIYNCKIKEISVTRRKKCSCNDCDCNICFNEKYIDNVKKFYIPLFYDKLILKGEGDDSLTNNESGNIIIKINQKHNNKYIRINDYDLSISINISLYEYIYGIDIDFIHIDDIKYNIKCDNPIYNLCHKNNMLLYKIDGLGLPHPDYSKTLIRGDLYVNFNIENINNFKNILHESCLSY